MFDIYEYRHDPIFEWGALPEEPYSPEPPPPPSQIDATKVPDGSDSRQWFEDILNPPSEHPPARLDKLEEANQAFEAWLRASCGDDYLDYHSSGGLTPSLLEWDFKSDLAAGKAEAWNAIWEFAEYFYGVKDIRSDPIFMASIAMTIAKSLYGTSEGWLWDASKGRLVPDPDYVLPSEAADESGNEDDDEAHYHEDDHFVFEDWDDYDDGDDWSVRMEFDDDNGDGGRDL
jgi:hypothetical protein